MGLKPLVESIIPFDRQLKMTAMEFPCNQLKLSAIVTPAPGCRQNRACIDVNGMPCMTRSFGHVDFQIIKMLFTI